MAKMKAPEGSTGASYNGESYKTDKSGHINVPEDAVAALLSHGFTLAAEQPSKKAAAAEAAQADAATAEAEPAAE